MIELKGIKVGALWGWLVGCVVVVVLDLWVGIIRRWRVERVAVGLRKGQMAGGKKQIINFSLRLCVTRFTINMVGAVWHRMRTMCVKVYITFYQ